MMHPKNFDPITRIGRGGYGEVILARAKVPLNDIKANELVAIKIISKSLEKSIVAETDALMKVQKQPFLCHLYGTFQDYTNVFYVLKYEENGSLSSAMQKQPLFTLEFAHNVIVDTLLGLKYLHSKNILHGDLKPANILIDRNHRAIVSDFGMCKPADQRYTGRWGSTAYQSPEQLMVKADWGSKVDLFAVGIIFVQMVLGEHPFVGNSKTEEEFLTNIKELKFKMPLMYHPAVVSFIHLTLCYEQRRLNINALMAHQFIKPKLESAMTTFNWADKSMMNDEITSKYPLPYNNHTSLFKDIGDIPFVGYRWGTGDNECEKPADQLPVVLAALNIDPEKNITTGKTVTSRTKQISKRRNVPKPPLVIDEAEDKRIRAFIRTNMKPWERRAGRKFDTVRLKNDYYNVCSCGKPMKVIIQNRPNCILKISVQPFVRHFVKHIENNEL